MYVCGGLVACCYQPPLHSKAAQLIGYLIVSYYLGLEDITRCAVHCRNMHMKACLQPVTQWWTMCC
jgi:hypothetical protein